MTRDELLRLIARALRRSVTFISEGQAAAAADTVLRDLRAAGLRILSPVRIDQRPDSKPSPRKGRRP